VPLSSPVGMIRGIRYVEIENREFSKSEFLTIKVIRNRKVKASKLTLISILINNTDIGQVHVQF